MKSECFLVKLGILWGSIIIGAGISFLGGLLYLEYGKHLPGLSLFTFGVAIGCLGIWAAIWP